MMLYKCSRNGLRGASTGRAVVVHMNPKVLGFMRDKMLDIQ